MSGTVSIDNSTIVVLSSGLVGVGNLSGVTVIPTGSSTPVTLANVAANTFTPANLAGLPTVLPATPGQPWNNGGILCIS